MWCCVVLCCDVCVRYSCAKAVLLSLFLTFFSVFNVPVFWPILLLYFIVLFVLTMKRQLAHMWQVQSIAHRIASHPDRVIDSSTVSIVRSLTRCMCCVVLVCSISTSRSHSESRRIPLRKASSPVHR